MAVRAHDDGGNALRGVKLAGNLDQQVVGAAAGAARGAARVGTAQGRVSSPMLMPRASMACSSMSTRISSLASPKTSTSLRAAEVARCARRGRRRCG
jgi:hypothetical protein